MTTKKVLLMVGLLAAIGIAYWAFNAPVEDGEEGAIGAANRYRAEQMTESDVNLEDEDVITLLQDDVFLELIQDEDFQTLMRNEDFSANFVKDGSAGYWKTLTPQAVASHENVIRFAAHEKYMAVAQSDKVQAYFQKRANVEGEGRGRWSTLSKEERVALAKIADNVAAQKGFDVEGLGKTFVERLNNTATIAALSRTDVYGLMKTAGYQKYAKYAYAELGARERVALQKGEDVASLKKGEDVASLKKGEDVASLKKGENVATPWQKYHAMLQARNDIELNKTHYEGWSKHQNLQVIAMGFNVERLMASQKVAALASNERVMLAMQNVRMAGGFDKNFTPMFGKHGIMKGDVSDGRGRDR